MLTYSAGKEEREAQRDKIISHASEQGWNKTKFPFHIILAHYEVRALGFCFFDYHDMISGGDKGLCFLAKVLLAVYGGR